MKVWDTSTGREIVTLRGHSDRVYCVAYSPDGRLLVTGGADQVLKVWDVATGRERLTLRGHSGPVEDVAFSPDGGRIASAGRDSTRKAMGRRHRPGAVHPARPLVTCHRRRVQRRRPEYCVRQRRPHREALGCRHR